MLVRKISMSVGLISMLIGAGAEAREPAPTQERVVVDSGEVDRSGQMHTSDFWYRHPGSEDYWQDSIILDPDGWRNLPDAKKYWYTQKISQEEFFRRLSVSTIMRPKNKILDQRSKPAPF
jgi:hypothetical protein